MSAIGLLLPYDTLGSRDAIDPELRDTVAAEVGKVISRFTELTPPATPNRVRGAVWKEGPKASYLLPEEPQYEMSAWLINQSKYISPRERARIHVPQEHNVLVKQSLWTNVTGKLGSLHNVKGHAEPRIVRVEDKLFIALNHLFSQNIQGIEPTSALSIMQRVHDTLDLIEEKM